MLPGARARGGARPRYRWQSRPAPVDPRGRAGRAGDRGGDRVAPGGGHGGMEPAGSDCTCRIGGFGFICAPVAETLSTRGGNIPAYHAPADLVFVPPKYIFAAPSGRLQPPAPSAAGAIVAGGGVLSCDRRLFDLNFGFILL